MFVFVVVTGFFMTTVHIFISWKKNYVFNFLVKHISVFFNHVLLCVFFIICQCFVIYWDIYIYILYIHQRIDLRFCCGSVRLFLVHIVCFTDIFTSLHLNHHTCTSPKPTRSFYTNTLTKFNCFHSVRGCLFTLTATIDIAFFTIYWCLHLYYGHEQGILNKKVLFFIQMANSLRIFFYKYIKM